MVYAFREMYERELLFLEKVLSPGDLFIDVGACYGIYSTVASTLVGGTGKVICFEPAREAFSVLRRNVDSNGLTNVALFRLALSDKKSKAFLHHHADPSRNSLARDPSETGSYEEVLIDTLDNLVNSRTSEKTRAIKLDVEGAEELVLRGADHLLRQSRPTVIFEVNPECAVRMGLSPHGSWFYLKGMGYDFFSLDNLGTLRPIVEPPISGNVIAAHPEGGDRLLRRQALGEDAGGCGPRALLGGPARRPGREVRADPRGGAAARRPRALPRRLAGGAAPGRRRAHRQPRGARGPR